MHHHRSDGSGFPQLQRRGAEEFAAVAAFIRGGLDEVELEDPCAADYLARLARALDLKAQLGGAEGMVVSG